MLLHYYLVDNEIYASPITFNSWVQAWKNYNKKSKQQKQLLATTKVSISDHHGITTRSWTHDQLIVHNNKLFIGSFPLTNHFFVDLQSPPPPQLRPWLLCFEFVLK